MAVLSRRAAIAVLFFVFVAMMIIAMPPRREAVRHVNVTLPSDLAIGSAPINPIICQRPYSTYEMECTWGDYFVVYLGGRVASVDMWVGERGWSVGDAVNEYGIPDGVESWSYGATLWWGMKYIYVTTPLEITSNVQAIGWAEPPKNLKAWRGFTKRSGQ